LNKYVWYLTKMNGYKYHFTIDILDIFVLYTMITEEDTPISFEPEILCPIETPY